MRKFLLFILIIVAFLLGVMIFAYGTSPLTKVIVQGLKSPPSISAKQALLIDTDTGDVLYEKNSSEKGYPASTTKIMTALVTLDICKEQGIDISQKVIIPKEAEGVEGSSAYLKAGKKKSIEELLYASMLVSGNDSATALAITMGGSLENFVDLMNEKAKALNLTGTHFSNPTGLFDENHYTTATDLAKISLEAMKYPEFAKIVDAKRWKNYQNKNKTLYQYEGGNGVKIGYTKKSGRTLVASAKKKDISLICVVLSDGNWFQDAYNLMDYGFSLEGYEDEEK